MRRQQGRIFRAQIRSQTYQQQEGIASHVNVNGQSLKFENNFFTGRYAVICLCFLPKARNVSTTRRHRQSLKFENRFSISIAMYFFTFAFQALVYLIILLIMPRPQTKTKEYAKFKDKI